MFMLLCKIQPFAKVKIPSSRGWAFSSFKWSGLAAPLYRFFYEIFFISFITLFFIITRSGKGRTSNRTMANSVIWQA